MLNLDLSHASSSPPPPSLSRPLPPSPFPSLHATPPGHLKIFKDATLFFSRGSPNLAAVIPAMDLIDTHLGNTARDETLDVAIRTAVGFAKRTMNRYYRMSDMSSTYRTAVGEFPPACFLPRHPFPRVLALHPRHKLRYFEKAGWPKGWIKEVRDMVLQEYNTNYRHLAKKKDDEDSDLEVLDDSDMDARAPLPSAPSTADKARKSKASLANVKDVAAVRISCTSCTSR